MYKKTYLFIACLTLILVCIPRFDFNDPWLVKKFAERPTDAKQYINYTKYFRGDISRDSLYKPYTNRILTPFIASKLPFDPLTSINLTNIFFLVLSLFVLYHILLKLNFNDNLSFIGCLMFSFSFPVFYYSVTGLVDSAVIFFITIGIFFILNQKWLLLSITFIIGVLAKETIIVLFPFLIMNFYYKKKMNLQTKYFIVTLNIVIVAVSYLLLTALVPGNKSVTWLPSIKRFWVNIIRIRAFLGMFLTLGIPGLLAIWYFTKNHFKLDHEVEVTFFTGFVTTILVFVYSLFSAYSDGRFVWLSYPFSIPLALLYIEKQIKAGKFRFINTLNSPKILFDRTKRDLKRHL